MGIIGGLFLDKAGKNMVGIADPRHLLYPLEKLEFQDLEGC